MQRFQCIELLQSVEDVPTDRGASSLKGAFLVGQGYVIELVDGYPFFDVSREKDPTRHVWVSVFNVKRAIPSSDVPGVNNTKAKWPANATIKGGK